MINISKHFTYEEVINSDTAKKKKINNNLPEYLIDNARAVAWCILEPVRYEFDTPIVPSSWYRSPELNKEVGGTKNSEHMQGFAVDFHVKGFDNKVVAQFIESELRFTQLILEYYNFRYMNRGWLHVSYDITNLKKEVLSYDGNSYKAGLS